MEKRLSNIFKTTNVMMLTKAILKSPYRALLQSLLVSFSACFINWSNFIVWLPFFRICPISRQYVYCNCFFLRRDVINFEINLIFLIKSFFLRDQKVKTKILRIERSFKDEKKHFSSVFKGFQLTKIVANLRLHFINYINYQKRTFV